VAAASHGEITRKAEGVEEDPPEKRKKIAAGRRNAQFRRLS
jgi:hypothetical protein